LFGGGVAGGCGVRTGAVNSTLLRSVPSWRLIAWSVRAIAAFRFAVASSTAGHLGDILAALFRGNASSIASSVLPRINFAGADFATTRFLFSSSAVRVASSTCGVAAAVAEAAMLDEVIARRDHHIVTTIYAKGPLK